MAIADRVAAAFAEPYAMGGVEHFVTASVGIAVARPSTREPIDADLLIRDADAAMYRAKERGRGPLRALRRRDAGRARCAGSRSSASCARRSSATSSSSTTSRWSPCAAARSPASRRWSAGSHPERGLLDPGEFVPVAEDSGLIEPIGRWVQESGLPPDARVARAAPRPAPVRRLGQPLGPPGDPPRPRRLGRARSSPAPASTRSTCGSRSPRASWSRSRRRATGDPGGAQRARRRPRPRRLRHRLLLARLPQPLPLRRAEDRPLLRRRARRRTGAHGDRRGDHRHGPGALARRDRRGGRERGAALGAAPARLRLRPGPPLLAGAAGGEDLRPARRRARRSTRGSCPAGSRC